MSYERSYPSEWYALMRLAEDRERQAALAEERASKLRGLAIEARARLKEFEREHPDPDIDS